MANLHGGGEGVVWCGGCVVVANLCGGGGGGGVGGSGSARWWGRCDVAITWWRRICMV